MTREGIPLETCHAASCFSNDQRTSCRVPRFQIGVPETIQTAERHVAEIQRRGAKTPDCAGANRSLAEYRLHMAHPGGCAMREPGAERGSAQSLDARHPYRLAVQAGPTAAPTREQLTPACIVHGADFDCAADFQRKRR